MKIHFNNLLKRLNRICFRSPDRVLKLSNYNDMGLCKNAAQTALIRMTLLLSFHSDQYYINTSSLPSMRNVLVLTMPKTRNYIINSDLKDNNTVRTPDFQITQLLVLLLHFYCFLFNYFQWELAISNVDSFGFICWGNRLHCILPSTWRWMKYVALVFLFLCVNSYYRDYIKKVVPIINLFVYLFADEWFHGCVPWFSAADWPDDEGTYGKKSVGGSANRVWRLQKHLF